MIQKKSLTILFGCLVLALALVAIPFVGAMAIDTMPAPLDPQNWQSNKDKTWDDFAPNPVIDWMAQLEEDGLANAKAISENRNPQQPVKGAIILVDFIDKPFISSQPIGSDLFGFNLRTKTGWQSAVTNNPVLNNEDRATLGQWWADYLNKKLTINGGSANDEFWRENSYGKMAVDLTPFGPYTLNGLELQYGGLNSNTERPPSLRTSGNLLNEAIAAALDGADGRAAWDPDEYDFFFVLHSGYDESGVWLPFGMMQWPAITLADAKKIVPDLYGPKTKLTELEGLFTAHPEHVERMATKAGATQLILDEAAKIASMRTAGTIAQYEFKFPASEWEWAEECGNAAGTRYVAWTAWAARISYWSGAGGYTYQNSKVTGGARTIRRSIQGENDGMATFAHEFGHISGLGDNYGNPYTDRASARTEPWELMSRGSFAGPYGDQARWTVPGIEAGSVPVHYMAFNKTADNMYDPGDVLEISVEGLASTTPVVAEIVARNIPLNNRVAKDKDGNDYKPYQWLEDEYGLASPNYYKALRLNFGSGEWADQAGTTANRKTVGFSWNQAVANRMFVEVVQRTGYDSFTPDDGVILSRDGRVVDSHLDDIAMIDYVQKDGFGPGIDDHASFTVGAMAQLYDAAFHVGQSFNDTGYYRSEYDPTDPNYDREEARYFAGEGNFSWQKAMIKPGSEFQWEERNGRDIASGDTVNEWHDPFNKLHFYILDKSTHDGRTLPGETEPLQFLSYTVAVLHDDGVAVGGELKVELADVDPETPGKVAVAYFDITNTGNATDIIRAEAKGLDAVLLNNLYAIEAGETITVPVYFELADDEAALANQTVTFIASSESNSEKSGLATVMGKNLYAGKVNVIFPGIKGVTLKYYNSASGWVTAGVFDDTGKFDISGPITVQALKDGMWYTFSNVNVGDEPLVLKVPLSTITVTGIMDTCDLGIVQEDWAYRYAPAKVGEENVYKVFDNGKNYEVRLYRAGFYPISITGVEAGQTATYGSDYFYKVYVAQGVTDAWISSYDWAVRGAKTLDLITLLMDPNNIRDAKMRYTLDGETFNVEFKLDGSNPFESFYTVYAKDTPEQSIEKIKAINPDFIEDDQTQPTFTYSNTNNPNTNTSTIFEEVWIEVPCDTDEDGLRDLIRIQVARPAETGVIIDPLSGETAVSVPVLMEHSPYRTSFPAGVYTRIPNWPAVHDQAVNLSTAEYEYLTDVMTKKPRANNWSWTLTGTYWDYDLKQWVIDEDGGNPSWFVTPRAGTPEGAWFIPESRGTRSVVFQANWPASISSPSATYQYYYTRGYAIVISSSIGNNYNEIDSEGFPNCGNVEETLCAMAIIQWLNGEPSVKGYTDRNATKEVKATWCNGNVAMTGQSYVGTLPQATACSGVDGIKAILPIAAISSWYDYYRGNGAVVAAYNFQGEDADMLTDNSFGLGTTAKFQAGYVTDPKTGVAAIYEKYLTQMHIDQDRDTGNYTTFWDDRNYLTTIDSVPEDCGVMIMHGLDDWNVKKKQPDQFYRALKDAGKNVKEIWHLGAHATVWDKVDSHYMEYYHMWLDHFLYLLDNDAMDIPEINMPNGNNVNWEFYDQWPIAGSTRQTWYLNTPTAAKAGAFSTTAPAAGTAGTMKDDTVANAALVAPLTSGIHTGQLQVVNGQLNAWEARLFAPPDIDKLSSERLAFATEPLAEPLRLNGTVTVGLEISADKGWGSISAVLVEVGPNYRSFGTANTDPTTVLNSGHGTANITLNNYTVANTRTDYKIITRGYGDVQNPNPAKETYLNAPKANGYIPAYYYRTQTITPGEKYKYYFEMETMDYTFKAGNRLALYVYTTDYRTTIVPLNPPTLTLYTGADTYLELPIVPTYSIFYDANGGGGLYDDIGGYSDTYPIAGQSAKAWEGGYRIVSGVGNTSVVKLNANAPWTFDGWNTAADGSGTAYQPNDRIADADMGDLNLFAQWSATVELDVNGGALPVGVTSPITVLSTWQLEDLPVANKISHTFIGWALDGELLTDEGIASVAGKTLVAQYEADVVEPTNEEEEEFLALLDYDHVDKLAQYLTEEIGNRYTASFRRDMAAEWIMDELESYGYEPYIHDFTTTSSYKNGCFEVGGKKYMYYGPAVAAETVYKFTNDTVAVTGVEILGWNDVGSAFALPEGANVSGKAVIVTLNSVQGTGTGATVPSAANYYGAALALQTAGAKAVIFETPIHRNDWNTTYTRIANTTAGADITIPVGTTLYYETHPILSGLGATTEVTVNMETRNDGKNVLAVLPSATGSTKNVYITAHFDSMTSGPGMNDNGSGTVMTLEMARAFKDAKFEYNLVFFFCDAEETGLRGARAYCIDMTDEERANFVANYNMDMISTAQADCIHFFLNISDTALRPYETPLTNTQRLINIPEAVEIAKKYDVYNHSYLAAQKLGFDMNYFNICYDTTTDHYAFVQEATRAGNNFPNMLNAVEYDWRRNEKGTSFEALYHKTGDTYLINYLGITPDGFPDTAPAPGLGLGAERMKKAGDIVSLAIFYSALGFMPEGGGGEEGITVNFPGVEGVTVQYWTGFWTTVPGTYDDTCTFEVPEGATITSVLAMKGGMWYQQDGLSWTSDSTVVFDVPVNSITVTGIGGACDLGLAQEDWVYRSAPAVVDQVIVYPVFDNAKKYIVHLNLPGAPTILIPDIAAGATVDISDYF